MRKGQFNIAHGLIAAICCVALTAEAQDFGGLLRGVLNNRSVDLMNIAIKSVAEVSLGQIGAGTQAPQDAEGKVVLYQTSWCGYCKRAAAYMRQKNIPFVERDIEANSSYKTEYTRMGGKGPVPFLVFGTQTMQGFSEAAIDSNYAAFQRSLANTPSSAGGMPSYGQAGPRPSGAMPPQSGDTLVGKISGVKVYAHASKSAALLLTTNKTEEMIYMGEEREGFYRVTTAQGEGWVDKLLVRKL